MPDRSKQDKGCQPDGQTDVGGEVYAPAEGKSPLEDRASAVERVLAGEKLCLRCKRWTMSHHYIGPLQTCWSCFLDFKNGYEADVL